jgi:hypothetical protein
MKLTVKDRFKLECEKLDIQFSEKDTAKQLEFKIRDYFAQQKVVEEVKYDLKYILKKNNFSTKERDYLKLRYSDLKISLQDWVNLLHKCNLI